VILRQDFVQAHNNIFDTAATTFIEVGERYSDDREPFYPTIYNNTFVNSALRFGRDDDGGADGSSYPGSTGIKGILYSYNNIIDSYPAGGDSYDSDIYFTYSGWSAANITPGNINYSNNLFTERLTTTPIILLGDNGDTVETQESFPVAYGGVTFTTADNSTLYSSGRVTNGAYNIGPATIADGGTGGSHPYLPGITIPSYVGATNPDDDAWVGGVLAMNVTYFTSASAGSNPSWIEGAALTTSIKATGITFTGVKF